MHKESERRDSLSKFDVVVAFCFLCSTQSQTSRIECVSSSTFRYCCSLSVLCFNCLNDKTRMPLFVSDEKWFMMRGRHSLSRKAKQGFERRDYSTRKQLWWWWWRCPAKVPANFNYQSQEEESTSFEWHTRLKNSGEKIHSIHCLNDTLFVITVNDGCSHRQESLSRYYCFLRSFKSSILLCL